MNIDEAIGHITEWNPEIAKVVLTTIADLEEYKWMYEDLL